MNLRRVASVGSALVVSGIAAYASYSHMRHLALEYGQDHAVAALLPLSVDGLMVVATVALGDGRRNRWSAWLAFWSGVLASVLANVLAAEPSTIARCISAWCAVAFLMTVEVITRGGRTKGVTEVADEVTAEPADEQEEQPSGDTRDEVSPQWTEAAVKVARARQRYPSLRQEDIAVKAGVSLSTAKRWWPFTAPVSEPVIRVVNGNAPKLEGAPA